MCFQMIKFAHKFALYNSKFVAFLAFAFWHLHFGTGLEMYCKSDFSSCELYYPWLPDCRVGQSCPQDFLGEMFLVPLQSASLFKQLKLPKISKFYCV